MGIVLLLAAAFAVVIRLRTDEKRNIQAMRCATAVVRHTERKIRLYGAPTEDILCDFDNSSGFRLPSASAHNGFQDTLSPLLSALREPEYKVFSEFIEKLGHGYREDTLKLCAFTLSSLEESVVRAEAEHPSKVKLYTALPILSAVSLLVLLL